MTQSYEQLKSELEDYKCIGRYCQHETSEDHYILDIDFILAKLQEHDAVLLTQMEEKRKVVDSQDCVCIPREGLCQNCIDELHNETISDCQSLLNNDK